MYITSKDNANLKLYRKLSSSKKERDERGLFVMEGERLIFDNFERVKTLFITPYFEGFAPKAASEKVNIITSDIAKNISSACTPQGVFAICEKPAGYDLHEVIKSHDKFVILINLQDPGNVGTIIRTACALSVEAVFCVNCCDVFNPKTIRSTMGATFRIPVLECGENELFEELNTNNADIFAAVTDGETLCKEMFRTSEKSQKSAIVIGNEANGLPSEIIKKCTRKISIPILNIESLNAAQAAAILIWEIF